MDAFSYLSVLLSIILGLAITQILQGYRGLLLARVRVKIYLPTMLWSVLLLVITAQAWWTSFGLARHQNWTFLQFCAVLTQMIMLYMMCGLVLPDFPKDERVDLKDHFYRERRPFFAALLLTLASSVGRVWILEGRLPETGNLAFHGVFAALAVAGFVISRPRFHEIVTPIGAMVMASYIAVLFAHLV